MSWRRKIRLTEQAQAAVEDNERRADVPLVSVVGECEHDDRGQNIRRRDKTL